MSTKIEQAYTKALELNLFGKRLRAKQLEVCETIKEAVGYKSITESTLFEQLVAYHEKQKVVKQVKTAEPIEPIIRGEVTSRDETYKVLPCGSYIISAAQNNTPAHKGLMGNITKLAEGINATVLLMPIKYTTNLDALSRETPVYLPEVKPYMVEENTWIGGRGRVRLAVTANILPTAKQPINTAQRLNNGEQVTIVAHTKRQLKTLPRQKNGSHKWAVTTGAATLRHYTDTRAGDEGEQSHFFGFIVLRVNEDGTTYMQEVQANERGDFNFDKHNFSMGVVTTNYSTAGLVLGDLHCEKMCANSWSRAKQTITKFNPETVVVHDVLDFMSRNHHNRQSGKFLYQMGNRAVLDDVSDVINLLNELAELTDTVYIVQSNHDLALDRWLDCPHYRPDADPVNSKVYHFMKYCLYDALDNGLDWDGLELAANKLMQIAPELPVLSDKIVFGKVDEAFMVANHDVSHHGHQGTNGARGSARAFLEYNTPMVTGHTHSPYREGNLLTVGVTGSLEMGYNKGGTSWDRANAVIFNDGTSALVLPYLIGEQQY